MISCESWQSRHVAASSWPAFSARPWTLALKLSVCRAWHRPQFTDATGLLSSGCLAVMSAWQLMQSFVLCADNFNLAASTKSEIALPAELVLNSVLSPWQSRQSLFFTPAEAGTVAIKNSMNNNEGPRFIMGFSIGRATNCSTSFAIFSPHLEVHYRAEKPRHPGRRTPPVKIFTPVPLH